MKAKEEYNFSSAKQGAVVKLYSSFMYPLQGNVRNGELRFYNN